MTRGLVLPLTAEQRVARMKYLAGMLTIEHLDFWPRATPVELDTIPGYEDGRNTCADGYYLLKDHNGGKDPTAIDPFDRWSMPGKTFVNRTADCIGAMAWCGGFDRYQPVRFAHLYDGWINTDSMLMDAIGPKKCFEVIIQPEPGCFVVFASGSCGHAIGHIGGVIEAPDGTGWCGTDADWGRLVTVDNASRGQHRSNIKTPDVHMWQRAHAKFVRPTLR